MRPHLCPLDEETVIGRRVTLLALGSRGDVLPFISLGRALQYAGHLVRVATFAAFAPLIQGAGLGFTPLLGDAEALLRSAAQGDALFGRNPVEGIRALARSYGSLTRSLPDALASLADPDLILNQLPSFLFGGDLARRAVGQVGVAASKPLF